jgi:hypothetical protein
MLNCVPGSTRENDGLVVKLRIAVEPLSEMVTAPALVPACASRVAIKAAVAAAATTAALVALTRILSAAALTFAS